MEIIFDKFTEGFSVVFVFQEVEDCEEPSIIGGWMEGCQVRQSTLIGSTRETGSSYLRCTEVGT
jgi:hypothetical protein